MPWEIKGSPGNYFVVTKETGKRQNKNPHKTIEEAKRHLQALYANVAEASLKKG
jgi:hypothetical protein